MRTLAQRRGLNVTMAIGLSIILLAVWWSLSATLIDTALVSGTALTALVILLAAYNVRKKFSFLPLGSSAVWLQIHIYVGLLVVILFGVHIRFVMPRGALELLLAAIFAFTTLSGVFGLLISRLFARRLAQSVEEVIYERIGGYRRRLSEEMRELAVQSVHEGEATTISDFYAARLMPYLDRPRSFWTHVFGLRRGSHPLVHEALDIARYLKGSEKALLDQIIIRVRVKDDLDFQYALQTILKLWLFVHIPLTYGLLLIMLVHIVLVLAFAGG